jgi:hypothetical protein
MQPMTGHCLCGAVRFEADDVERDYHACHCGMCRRWTGGPFFAARARALRFADEAQVGRYASSEWAERGFCTRCGAALFYLLRPTGEYFVSVGAFAGAAEFRLASELCIDRKPADYAFAGERPRLREAEVFASPAGDAS